jgi:lipid-A-disaccharide synthase
MPFSKINFFGFWEVFINLPMLFRAMRETKEDIAAFRPDVLILIDFSGYNMRMAAFAKEVGIKVFYYISPKIWAWNTKRAYKIKRLVDKMFVILPFEVGFYKQFDYEVDYVGNPIMDAITSFQPSPSFKEENQLGAKPIIALLPGSRASEVSKLLDLLLKLPGHFPSYQLVVAGVSSLPTEMYEAARQIGVKVVMDRTYDLLTVAESAVVASGTATLETGLFRVPQVVVYRVSYISYEIARRLVQVRDIALVNLITDKIIVKTLLQKELTESQLVAELQKTLEGGSSRHEILKEYEKLAMEIGGPGASEKAGKLMVKYLKH